MNKLEGNSPVRVEFQRISKSYGDFDALKQFDLTIEPGEFLTLLGPSGSGKSTALNILAGFSMASSGTVKIGDHDVTRLPPERRNVGMVFQNYSLFPHMSVFDNVAFPLRLRRMKGDVIKEKVGKTLEMVQLSGFASRMPAELSGGQCQRVALARAIVFEPPVLLMDEPLAALDLKLREAMQFELKKIHAQLGCTIVFVTHDQGEALAMSDRVAVMSKGKIEQIDAPDKIYDAPNSKFVADFVGKTNLLDADFSKLPNVTLPSLGVSYTINDVDSEQLSGCKHVSLRPEQFTRSMAGEGDGPIISGHVSEVLFLGSFVQYSIQAGQGQELIFQERRSPDRPSLKRDESVQLGFSPSAAKPVYSGAA